MAEPDLAEPQTLIALLRGGAAPAEVRLFAARRLLPLDQNDQLRGLIAVLEDEDAATRGAARESLAATALDQLSEFLRAGSPTGVELDRLTRFTDDPAVLEQIIQHKNVEDSTLERIARTVTGGPQEALVVNQFRLLRQPALIEALFENPDLTADARRRLLEVREEFFDKETRRKEAEQERARDAEAMAAAEAQAALDLAALTPEEANARTGGPVHEDDLEKSITTGAVYRRIAVMTVSEKIKLAYGGGKEERRILVGDSNRLVGLAVLKSRGLTVYEVEAFCSMRQLNEDLFRKMARQSRVDPQQRRRDRPGEEPEGPSGDHAAPGQAPSHPGVEGDHARSQSSRWGEDHGAQVVGSKTPVEAAIRLPAKPLSPMLVFGHHAARVPSNTGKVRRTCPETLTTTPCWA